LAEVVAVRINDMLEGVGFTPCSPLRLIKRPVSVNVRPVFAVWRQTAYLNNIITATPFSKGNFLAITFFLAKARAWRAVPARRLSGSDVS